MPANFDPLKYLISKTRKKDIKIHAWINISYILNSKNYPPQKEHILAKHPEWATYDFKGRPITDYTKHELKKNLLEGYFLDPAIPGVKRYTNAVLKDLLSKYSLDGIHLDFIRYPYSGYNSYYKKYLSDFGYNPIARKIFKKKFGFDPITISPKKNSKAKNQFDKFRQDQITDIVKMLSNSARKINSQIIFSAAVMPHFKKGKEVYFQDWPLWIKNRYIDLACVMSYSSNQKSFNNYIGYAKSTKMESKILMGIMVRKKTSIKTVYRQILSTYNGGFRGYIIFSFEHDKNFIDNLTKIIDYNRYVYKL